MAELFNSTHISVDLAHYFVLNSAYPGPEVIKLFSCSTQLIMKFFLLINVKMPTTVGILTFMIGKNSILGLTEPYKAKFLDFFYTYEHFKFQAQLSFKSFITSGPGKGGVIKVFICYSTRIQPLSCLHGGETFSKGW